jgi:glycosyltransferase involved in cell wall biosynthesis
MSNLVKTEPKFTVIFLLYNAAKTVPALVEAIASQTHPDYPVQENWLEVLFMNDRSRDQTAEILAETLTKLGRPPHFQTVTNPENLGLSRTLNKALKMARTPFVLTCHCDCIFGRPDYVSSMMKLLETHPNAGSITGQPALPAEGKLPLAERINLISNLMDIFPPEGREELIPVGFAEGRCDAFRIAALEASGFYDTRLRLAGEDQVLAAEMRKKGFEVYQAPGLPYFLSVSDEQDTVGKLMKHMRLFGRAHPYILLKNRQTAEGALGKRAGRNRRLRTLLRVLQLASVAGYFITFGLLIGRFWLPCLGLFFLILAAKIALFRRHLLAIQLYPLEFIVFLAVQPLLDVNYTYGLAEGLWLVLRGKASEPIS